MTEDGDEMEDNAFNDIVIDDSELCESDRMLQRMILMNMM